MRGRIRTIKPEIFSDEELWDLAQQTGFPVLQAFAGLWCFADREGRFKWQPRRLKSMVLPYWEGDFAAILEALERAHFVVSYEVDGHRYGYVRNFSAHQRPDHREPPSIIPAPPPELVGPELPAVADTDAHPPGGAQGEPGHAQAAPGGKGRERKGTEGEGKGVDAPARAMTMPGAEPTKSYLDAALMAGVSRDQAVSTWTHYWTAGLPRFGVEKLESWLVKQAKERANQLAALPKAGAAARNGPNQPNAGLTGLEIFARKAS